MTINITRPASPEDLRNAAQQISIIYPSPPFTISRGAKGVIVRVLEDLLGGEQNRKMVLGFLFTPSGELVRQMSTKQLTATQWFFLHEFWLQISKIEGGWYPIEYANTECLELKKKLRLYQAEEEKKEDKPVRGRAI